MALITSSYFWGDLHIAGLSNTLDSNVAVFNRYVAKYENEYLTKLLGTILYGEFLLGLANPSPLAKWTDLRGKLLDSVLLVSPIANYVYYHYMRNLNTITSQIGEVKPNSENSINASNVHKQVRAWNEMVRLNVKIDTFLTDNNTVYTTYEQDYTELFELINSLNL